MYVCRTVLKQVGNEIESCIYPLTMVWVFGHYLISMNNGHFPLFIDISKLYWLLLHPLNDPVTI